MVGPEQVELLCARRCGVPSGLPPTVTHGSCAGPPMSTTDGAARIGGAASGTGL